MSIKELFVGLKSKWISETPIIYKKIVGTGATLGAIGVALEVWPGITSLPLSTQNMIHYMTAVSIVIATWAQLQEKK